MTIRPIYIDGDALPANGTALQLKTGATGEVEASSGGGGGGGGGSTITSPLICYVQANGDDGTAVVGNPALPFLNSQQAFDAGVALSTPFCIHFGVGTHSGITVANDMTNTCNLTGEGFGVSIINEIYGLGAAGVSATADDTPGDPGQPGKTLLFDSDGTVDVISILSSGGTGGNGGPGATGGNGGDGGNNGVMRLRGVWGSGLCASEGGSGGSGGGGSGITGNQGGGAYVTLFKCVFGNGIYVGTGYGSSAGLVRITQCTSGTVINVIASGGYVNQCNAESFSVTGGPTEAGNTTGANAHTV